MSSSFFNFLYIILKTLQQCRRQRVKWNATNRNTIFVCISWQYLKLSYNSQTAFCTVSFEWLHRLWSQMGKKWHHWPQSWYHRFQEMIDERSSTSVLRKTSSVTQIGIEPGTFGAQKSLLWGQSSRIIYLSSQNINFIDSKE